MGRYKTKGKSMKTCDSGIAGISQRKTPVRRNLAKGNGDHQPLLDDQVDEEAKKTRRTFLDNMDAIACAIEAWFEEETGYSRRVRETTIDIARALGVSEDEIEKWSDYRLARLIRDKEKLNVIKSLLIRL